MANSKPPPPRRRLRRGLLALLGLLGTPILLMLAAHFWLVSQGVAYRLHIDFREPSVEVEFSKPLPWRPTSEAPRRVRRLPRVWRPRPVPAVQSPSALAPDVVIPLPPGADFVDVLRLLEKDARPQVPLHSAGLGTTALGLVRAECIVDESGVLRPQERGEVTFLAKRSDGKNLRASYRLHLGRATRTVELVTYDPGDGSPVGGCSAATLVAKAKADGLSTSAGARLIFYGSSAEWWVSPEAFGEPARRFRASGCELVNARAQESAGPPAEGIVPAPVFEPLATEPFPLPVSGADARGRLDLARVVGALDSHLRARLSAGKHVGLDSSAFVWLESLVGVLDAEGRYDTGNDSLTHVEAHFGVAAEGAGPRIYQYLVARRTAVFMGGDPSRRTVERPSAAPRVCSSVALLRDARAKALGPSAGGVITSRRTGDSFEWLVRAELGQSRPSARFGADCAFVAIE